jgi:hypothetical protein
MRMVAEKIQVACTALDAYVARMSRFSTPRA